MDYSTCKKATFMHNKADYSVFNMFLRTIMRLGVNFKSQPIEFTVSAGLHHYLVYYKDSDIKC